MKYLEKFQAGGTPAGAAPQAGGGEDPLQLALQGAQQAVQSGDKDMAMEVCMLLVDSMLGGAQGGGAQPQAFELGGSLHTAIAAKTEPVVGNAGPNPFEIEANQKVVEAMTTVLGKFGIEEVQKKGVHKYNTEAGLNALATEYSLTPSEKNQVKAGLKVLAKSTKKKEAKVTFNAQGGELDGKTTEGGLNLGRLEDAKKQANTTKFSYKRS